MTRSYPSRSGSDQGGLDVVVDAENAVSNLVISSACPTGRFATTRRIWPPVAWTRFKCLTKTPSPDEIQERDVGEVEDSPNLATLGEWLVALHHD